MLRRLAPILLLCAALCAQASAQGAPQPPLVQFPGSSWRLAPPPGFALSPTAGIRHPNGAFLALVEFPKQPLSPASFGPIGAITAGGTQDEGRLESVEAVMAGGRPAFLAIASMPNRAARSYGLFMEGERNNAGVTLTVPLAATDIDAATIRAALLSVTDRAAAIASAPPAASSQAAASPAPAAGSVRFPGTNWSLAPPPGFALSAGPPTLFRHPNGSGILLIETPRKPLEAGGPGVVGDIVSQGTPNEGRIEAIERLTLGGRPAELIRLRMTRRALVVHTVVIEGEGGNAQTSLFVPDGAAEPNVAAIRATLLSVSETLRSPEQRLGDLPFRLTDLAGMRVVTVVANTVVILTQGPGDQMDEATDQPFAMVSRMPMGPRDRFDPQRDVAQAASVIRERYPGATILTQKVEPTALGPVATVVFQRTPPGNGKAVAGVSWAWADGGAFMMMIGQFPPERPEFAAPLVKLRNGIKAK